MKQALIIFVRRPVLGKVKTRLAATIGNEAALTVYKKLLQHTLAITQTVPVDKFVFYADEITKDDMWQHDRYFKLQQADGDLGNRMLVAFEQVFAKGYEQVCIMGSDCPILSSQIIKDAFKALNNNDVVLGPAEDGGYYLLGMKELYVELFENKTWSTATVLTDTINSVEQLELRLATLPTLRDVDEAADVPAGWLAT